MNIQRIAAFSADGKGGNPAGVVLLQEPLPQPEMESIAAEVGYSETAFAVETGPSAWRVRYFSPESEVPFCGHATIALGAALGERDGEGSFQLQLNDAEISVSANRHSDGRFSATLSSPETHSRPLTASEQTKRSNCSAWNQKISTADCRRHGSTPELATSSWC